MKCTKHFPHTLPRGCSLSQNVECLRKFKKVAEVLVALSWSVRFETIITLETWLRGAGYEAYPASGRTVGVFSGLSSAQAERCDEVRGGEASYMCYAQDAKIFCNNLETQLGSADEVSDCRSQTFFLLFFFPKFLYFFIFIPSAYIHSLLSMRFDFHVCNRTWIHGPTYFKSHYKML